MKVLLEAGADPNLKDKYGKTALIWASAAEGHTEVVKVLLEAGADPNLKDEDGITALMGASTGGYTEVVKVLLEAGADPNLKERKWHHRLDVGIISRTHRSSEGAS